MQSLSWLWWCWPPVNGDACEHVSRERTGRELVHIWGTGILPLTLPNHYEQILNPTYPFSGCLMKYISISSQQAALFKGSFSSNAFLFYVFQSWKVLQGQSYRSLASVFEIFQLLTHPDSGEVWQLSAVNVIQIFDHPTIQLRRWYFRMHYCVLKSASSEKGVPHNTLMLQHVLLSLFLRYTWSSIKVSLKTFWSPKVELLLKIIKVQ